jgi:hypothetical protein
MLGSAARRSDTSAAALVPGAATTRESPGRPGSGVVITIESRSRATSIRTPVVDSARAPAQKPVVDCAPARRNTVAFWSRRKHTRDMSDSVDVNT